MKKPLYIIPLVIFLLFVFSCQQREEAAEEPALDIEADVDAIKAWYDLKTDLTNARDFDGLKVLFDENVIFMPPNEQLYKGWEVFLQASQAFWDEFDMNEKISYDEIEVSGDWAYVRSSNEIQVTPKAGGETTQSKGKAIWILKRHADGSWKGTHCIWNSDDPLPTPEENQ
jgi:ketosteroid isomerase-like protein